MFNASREDEGEDNIVNLTMYSNTKGNTFGGRRARGTFLTQSALQGDDMIVEFIGLTLSSDYNYQFDDTLDAFEFGEANDTFFRMSLGINFYFGGKQKQAKIMKNVPTVINSNRFDSQ